MSIKEKIDEFLDFFSTITRDEADYIEEILEWDNETKVAFQLAKRIFDEQERMNQC
jgi:hypothetical protein